MRHGDPAGPGPQRRSGRGRPLTSRRRGDPLRRPERDVARPRRGVRVERRRDRTPPRARGLGLAARSREGRRANGPHPLAGTVRDGRSRPRFRAADARARPARGGRSAPRGRACATAGARAALLALPRSRRSRRRRGRRGHGRRRSRGRGAATASRSSSSAPATCPVDDRVEALVLAAREAMSNAAQHSGADQVSTFVDVGDDEIAVFVRDRGSGFDPEALPAEAHGIAESIRGRMTRAGGTASLTRPREGTEVELRLGRQAEPSPRRARGRPRPLPRGRAQRARRSGRDRRRSRLGRRRRCR